MQSHPLNTLSNYSSLPLFFFPSPHPLSPSLYNYVFLFTERRYSTVLTPYLKTFFFFFLFFTTLIQNFLFWVLFFVNLHFGTYGVNFFFFLGEDSSLSSKRERFRKEKKTPKRIICHKKVHFFSYF